MTPKRIAIVALVAVLAPLAAYLALQPRQSLRFELGSMDWDLLGDPEGFYPSLRMEGPIRREDGSVEVIDFYGRLTKRKARFQLPVAALRSPVRLHVRAHRFGLGGTVVLRANGEEVERFVFGETSYPWGGLDTVISQSVAERGPLTLELETLGGRPPPAHLPEDLGLGIDWLELEALSGGVRWQPGVSWLAFAALVPLSWLALLWGTGGSFRFAAVASALLAAGVSLAVYLDPVAAGMATRRLWVVAPLALLLFVLLRWRALRLAAPERRFLARLFALAALAHSVLVFFPDHAPPDLWNHGPQVEWLSSLDVSLEELYRYSSSSDPFDDGHVRPHFGVDYGAPYPPFFYLLTYGVSLVHGDVRFLIEFLSVLIGAAMLVPVFLLARSAWGEGGDGAAPRFAAILLLFELSLWHHVHRVHAPGNLGMLAVLAWLTLLVLGRDLLRTPRGLALFAAATALTALSYPASLFQVAIFSALFAALLFVGDASERGLSLRILLGVGLGFAAAFFLYYAPYAVQALRKSELILDRQTYDPPAAFWFLRNQMRDTVRILRNGYLFYLGLAVAGYALLGRGGASRFHRKVLAAAGLTYVAMLVLKDPLFLPMLFLHAKEDLFFAPVACVLGGGVLALLWRQGGRPGRAGALALVAVAALLQVRDQALNRDTLHDQPWARLPSETAKLARKR